jgi:hypothetical protein
MSKAGSGTQVQVNVVQCEPAESFQPWISCDGRTWHSFTITKQPNMHRDSRIFIHPINSVPYVVALKSQGRDSELFDA